MAKGRKKVVRATCTVTEDEVVVFEAYADTADQLLDKLIEFVYPEEEKKDGSEEDSEENNDNNGN